jgi:pimeloyl-ACP methyl ester carboxylesterase
MISTLNRWPRITALVARLSGAAAIGWALASGAHLLAVSDRSANVSSEVTTQPAEAGADGATSPEMLASSPALESYTRAIAFAPCADNTTLGCGTLTVPVDYRKPFGDTVEIAIIRARATNPTKRIGVIIGNPGGPGVSGVDFVLGIARLPITARLREHFDIVSFDPRGVGRSREVRCTLEGSPIPDDADDPTLIRLFDELSERYARACLDQNGSFAGHVGTMNTARDLEILRRALGERQITYAAGSYGTALGAAYASMFPSSVRAMMLDGAIPPDFRDYLVEDWAEMSAAFETSFQRLDQLCSRDPACALASVGVVAAFDEVAARLAAAPVSSPTGALLTKGALQDVIAALIDFETLWPTIVDALAAARAGDYSPLFALLPVLEGQSPNAFFAIRCSDYGTRKGAADYLPFDEAIGALHPRFFGRFFIANYTAPCTAWPSSEPVKIRDVHRLMRTPIMIVGNDFDSRTTMAHARRLARALGFERNVLRYAGGGHTAFFTTTACVQDTVVDYLVTLRLPREGFACPGQPVTFESTALRSGRSIDPAAVLRQPGFVRPLPRLRR